MSSSYEQEDPVGYWTNSADAYSEQVSDYTEQITDIEEQIGYAETVKEKCEELYDYDSYVDDDLLSLGNALSGAMDEDPVISFVKNINSENSGYIDDAVAKCDALIQCLENKKTTLDGKLSTAQANYDYSNGRATYYKNLGY